MSISRRKFLGWLGAAGVGTTLGRSAHAAGGTRSPGTFDIEVMKSIELLKLMLDCGHISVQKLDTVVSNWRYWQYIPFDLDADFTRFFGRAAPR